MVEARQGVSELDLERPNFVRRIRTFILTFRRSYDQRRNAQDYGVHY
jgi:hypothetical protein